MDNEQKYTEDPAGLKDESFIEERKEIIEELFEKTETYIKTNVQLLRLKAIARISAVISSMIANFAVVIVLFFFLMMLSAGVALWIGESIGSPYLGFMIVAGFYFLVVIILLISGKRIIQRSISNSMIEDLTK